MSRPSTITAPRSGVEQRGDRASAASSCPSRSAHTAPPARPALHRQRHPVHGPHRLSVADVIVLDEIAQLEHRRTLRRIARRGRSPGKSMMFPRSGSSAGGGSPAARRRERSDPLRASSPASGSPAQISTPIPARRRARPAASLSRRSRRIPSVAVRSSTSSSPGSRAIPCASATSARSQSASSPQCWLAHLRRADVGERLLGARVGPAPAVGVRAAAGRRS